MSPNVRWLRRGILRITRWAWDVARHAIADAFLAHTIEQVPVILRLVTAALIAGSAMVTSQALAPATSWLPYLNCASFNTQHPVGIAVDLSSARAIVFERGVQRPRVSQRTYDTASRWNPLLDLDRDGVLCPVDPTD